MNPPNGTSTQRGRILHRQATCWAVLGTLLVVLFACLLLVPARTALALASANGEWEYDVNPASSTQITLTKYHGSGGYVDVPDELDGYEVTGIATSTFKDNTSITDVYVHSSMQVIGGQAFTGCTNLKTIDFSDAEQLLYIPNQCFENCTALTKAALPASVASVVTSAFKGCTALSNFSWGDPSSCTEIGESAFEGCTGLTSFEIPLAAESILKNAFKGCTGLTELTFETDSLKLIKSGAFEGCTGLEEIYIPDSTRDDFTLEAGAFKNCTGLKTVMFTKMPAVMGDGIFTGSSNVVYCYVPSSASIEQCLKLDIDPETNKMTWFDMDSDGANGLVVTKLWVQNSSGFDVVVRAKIGNRYITKIADHAASTKYSSPVGPPTYQPCRYIYSLTFPEDSRVTYIGEEAFRECSGISFVVLPASLETLGKGAFYGCTRMSSVTFSTALDPNTNTMKTALTEIPTSAFELCTNLKGSDGENELYLPEGITGLKERAFFNCCSLTKIHFPDTLTAIGEYALTGDWHASEMQINYIRMPDANNEIAMPADSKLMERWAHNGTVKFEVTYGSWADYFWFKPHLDNRVFKDSNRVYKAVDIGTTDGSITMTINTPDTAYTGARKLPSLKATRWNETILQNNPVTGQPFDYDIAVANGYDCKSVGEQHATIIGRAPHFTGSIDVKFTIDPADITKATMAQVGPFTWDENTWEPGRQEDAGELKISIVLDGVSRDLVLDTDFTLGNESMGIDPYKDNTAPGEATVSIVGIGNYAGTKDFHFTINKGDLSKAVIDAIPDQRYTDGQIKPKLGRVRLKDRHGNVSDELLLYEGQDFTVEYGENKEVGQGTGWVKLTGTGDYVDSNTSATVNFNIITANLADATIGAVDDQVYTGSAIRPALNVSLGGDELVEGTHYRVTWKNNLNIGEATGTVEGIEPYCEGTRTVKFKITPKPVTVQANHLYKTFGDPEPKLTATVEGTVGTDTVAYSLSRETGEDVGTYVITASGEASQGNYRVTFKDGTFTIEPASVTDAAVASIDDVTFDGATFEPTPAVTWKGRTLERDKDYTLSYADNLHAGQAAVTVKGIGNFKDEVERHFEIAPLDLSSDGCEVFVTFQVHTGSALEPHPRRVTAPGRDGVVLTLVEGTDYEIRDGAWTDNVDVGTGHVVVNGIGDYCESRTGDFNIVNDGALSQGYIDDIPAQVYTGGPIEPVLRVYLKGVDLWLRRDVDYTATFEDNVNVGAASVTVTGIDPLYGSLSSTFAIEPADIGEAVVAVADVTYDGTAQEPVPAVTWNEMLLIEGTDYEVVSYEGNVHAGTATVTVKGIGNFEGEASGKFNIAQRKLTVTANSAERAYTGGPLVVDGFTSEGLAEGDAVVSATVAGSQTDVGFSPSTVSDAKVENAAGEDVTTDYDISYEDGTLNVTQASIADAVVAVPDQTFTGGPLEPSPTVTWNEMLLIEGTDYEVTGYAGNVHAGTAKVTVKGIGNFDGEATGEFQITPARMAETVVAVADVTYDGTEQEPTPTVTWGEMLLVEGVDYEVAAYEGNVHAGTARLTVKGIGDFEGETTGEFAVARRPLTVTPDSAEREYDGTTLTAGDFASEGLAEGDVVTSAKIAGSQTDAGSSANVVSGAKVANAAGEDVTADYEITYAEGTLTVLPYSPQVTVTVTGQSASWTYDGAEHAVEGYDMAIDCELYGKNDFTFSGKASAAGTNAGEYAMGLAAADFANASGNFASVVFAVEDGVLTIEPADLGDAQRFSIDPLPRTFFDGTAKEPRPVVHDAVTGTELVEGTDYALAYRNNVEVGTAVVALAGMGNYAGVTSTTFEIAEATAEYVLLKGPDGEVDPAQGGTVEFEFSRVGDDEHTLEHFVSAEVDGRKLGESDYTVRRGSAIVTLMNAYLKTLSPGVHALTATFDDGETSAEFIIAEPKPGPDPGPDPQPTPGPKPLPGTGDGAAPIAAMLVLVALGAAFAALRARER